MNIQFEDAAEEFGRYITNDAFTQACNEPGDASIVIGFAPNQYEAEQPLLSNTWRKEAENAFR